MARATDTRGKSLAALATALDTRKRPLPGEARTKGLALRAPPAVKGKIVAGVRGAAAASKPGSSSASKASVAPPSKAGSSSASKPSVVPLSRSGASSASKPAAVSSLSKSSAREGRNTGSGPATSLRSARGERTEQVRDGTASKPALALVARPLPESAARPKTPSPGGMTLKDIVKARLDAPERSRTSGAFLDAARSGRGTEPAARPVPPPPRTVSPPRREAPKQRPPLPASRPLPSEARELKHLPAPVASRPQLTFKKPPAPSTSNDRKFPRAELHATARLSLADDPARFFEASLSTLNISVGGMFLESEFFLKLGTRLIVELTLPPKGRVVKVKGEVVRVSTNEQGKSGFALRFVEYFEGSHVALATHFLSPMLKDFIEGFSREHDFKAGPEYIAHTIDVISAWELRKAELGADVWMMTAPA